MATKKFKKEDLIDLYDYDGDEIECTEVIPYEVTEIKYRAVGENETDE